MKETAKVTPKIEKYVYYTFTDNICSACNPMQVVVFCHFVEKRIKFSHFEGELFKACTNQCLLKGPEFIL